MLENINNHRTKIESLIKNNPPHTDWARELDFFQLKLLHLQKERLIHLIVTMTTGLATLISVFFTLLNPVIHFFVFNLILTILFIAYLLHYRKLENTTQSLYPLFDKLREKTIT